MGNLKYLPSGTAVCEFTVAVAQTYFDRSSVGYFNVLMFGKMAEDHFNQLRIGQRLTVQGSLWARSFKNRQGIQINETKVLVQSLGGDDEEK